ncbi:MAG: prepilin-type N-terminal cleavage/methylation domain-containing protein, partial [Omnitrophica bacterium]|nr:prepilin-type N-terminal cleavage/methylation domain-containing protein [Candidatus Omnitrophota bacterium]
MTLQIGNKIPRNNFCFSSSVRFTNPTLLRAGFTLIELVLVILLISILTAISTPLFRRTFSDIVLKNTAYDMAKVINYIGEMAIIEKVKYKLNLDFENGKYWITKYGLSEEGVVYGRVSGRYGKDFFLPR